MKAKTTAKHKTFFDQLLPGRCSVDPDILRQYGSDRTRILEANPLLVVFPTSTSEVKSVVSYCHKNDVPFVPSGGRTGYAGAAVASKGEVVLSMDRMNRILNIDLESGTAEAEAGVILETFQQAIVAAGMMFPLDFGARGSCQLGGCIATNAGGHKVIKYGMTRDLVVGLEVVTPNGDLLDLNANLHKNNSGYDLKQLFIGAEGTLGVVTRATMKIVPPPKHLELAFLAFDDLNGPLEMLKAARIAAVDVTAFELISKQCLDAVMAYRPQSLNPLSTACPYYALMESDSGSGPRLESFLASVSDAKSFRDAYIADSNERFRQLWAIRDTVSEAIFHMGRFHKSDVAVPVSRLPAFIKDLTALIEAHFPDLEVFLFGHIGDGNIHVNLVDRSGRDVSEFTRKTTEMEWRMCDLIKIYDGSISAEHGIGLLKKHLLTLRRSPEDLDLMRGLKRLLDPQNLCNPGKILD